MALTQTQVSQLYVSIFGRASEGAGNTYWQTTADMATAANTMLATDAAATYFGTSLATDLAFVKHIYLNTLGKTYEQDTAGVDGWVTYLATHTRGEMVAALVYAAQQPANAGAAQDMFNNKVAVSDYTADNIATAGSDLSAFQSYISSVTSDAATVTAAKASILAAAPTTFTLTTAATDNIVGTDAAETIVANNSSISTEGTLQATDKIDGGAGADSANITLKGTWAGFTSGSMKAVETVNMTNNSTAALSFAAAGVTDVTKYIVNNSVANTNATISSVATLADVEVSGTAGASTLSVGYTATSTVATGSQTDVQNLKVTNVGTIDTDATSATNAKYMTVDIDKVETLAITTAGTANSLNLSGSADTKTITIAGEGQTEISAIDDTVTSFDASAATGKVIVDTTAVATNALTTLKTGAGDDTIKAATDDLTANATVAGGTGADTLSFTAGAAKTLQNTMTGVETIKVGAITGALTFSGTNVSDITTISTEGMGAAASFVNMKATPVTVNSIGAEATAADKISVDSAAAITYNIKASDATTAAGTTADTNNGDAEFANATAVTVNVGELVNSTGVVNTGAATTVALNVASKVVNSAETTIFDDTLTADSATSLTVTSLGQLATVAIGAAKATTATITAGSTATATDTIALTAAKLVTLDVTAKQAFDFTGSTFTKLQNLTVNTTKAFTMGGVVLADAASITLAGTASTAAATFGNLGTAATLTHDVNLTATGLKAGLTVGTIDAGTASSTINVTGVTGNVELGHLTANGGITLNAAALAGTLDAGTVSNFTTTTGNISIDVSTVGGAAQFGTLTTDGISGDVTVTATSAVGAVTTGVIKGDAVTVNGQNALNGVTVGGGYTALNATLGHADDIVAGTTVSSSIDIVAHSAVTYTGTNLLANGVNIGTDATSTALTATLAGGAAAESISIAGNTKQTSITVTGNLGAGTNAVTVLMMGNTASTDTTAAQTVNLSGVTGSSKSGTSTTTLLADLDSNITYTGSAVKDTIVLGGDNDKTITITDTVTDTVAGEKDVLVLGGAASQSFTGLAVSGVELLTVAATGSSANASAFSGDTISATLTGVLTLTDTTTGNDIIDLSNFTHAAAATNLLITASGGNDIIVGTAGTETITGGTGTDTMTGGTGVDVFAFAAGDSGGAPSTTNMDTITDFGSEAGNEIDWTGGSITVNSSAVLAAAGKAGLAGAGAGAGAKATFNAADDTLAEQIIAIEAALNDTTNTAGEAAHWMFGTDTYVYITDGVAGVSANDLLIKLTGVDSTSTSFDVMTIVSNNLTLA